MARTKAARAWKKGRDRLGPLDPLLGSWVAQAQSPMGPVRCARSFARGPGAQHVTLQARWNMGAGKKATTYDELCVFGKGDTAKISFWSFTSDGKRSSGNVADATDIHPEAVGFEAQMDAGLARQVYWPDGAGGFFWAVEANRKSGWSRFTEHHYNPA